MFIIFNNFFLCSTQQTFIKGTQTFRYFYNGDYILFFNFNLTLKRQSEVIINNYCRIYFKVNDYYTKKMHRRGVIKKIKYSPVQLLFTF